MPLDRRTTPVTAQVYRSLTMDWQSEDRVIEGALAMVPPGRAIRRYESNYSSAATKRTTSFTRPLLTQEEKLRSGARSIVRDSIASAQHSGRVEIMELDGERMIRLTSAGAVYLGDVCPECGSRAQDPKKPTSKTTPRSKSAQSTVVIYPRITSWELHRLRQSS